MALTLEVWDGSSWIDKTSSCVSLRRRIRPEGLEELDGELVKDVVSVGQKIRLREDNRIKFMGIVYEIDRRHRGGEPESCGFKAYDYLIAYDRHVVYKLYQTGTKAGEIIRDLGKLIDDEIPINLSGVEDGDSLLSPWEIQNQKALDIMKSVARGTNYWLRMRPCLSYLNFGGDDYVEIPEGVIDIHEPFTLILWFRMDDLSGDRTLLEFYANDSSRIRFVIRNGTEAINEIKSPLTYDRFLWGNITDIEIGRWYSWIAVVDPKAENENRLYINGEQQFTKFSDSSKWDSLDQPTRITIGYPAYYCTWWIGAISNVLLYQDYLDEDKISQILAKPYDPIRENLAGWWITNESSGSTVYDRSGNQSHGTVYGASWGYEVYPKYANSMLLEFKPKVIA